MRLMKSGARHPTLTSATFLALLGAASVSGCSSSSKNIDATYVSPLKYNSYSCVQLEQEYVRVSQQGAMINKQQDDIASNDSVAMGVGMVLFWPALFFIEGDDKKEEVGRLKGDVNAIEQSSIQKNCTTLTSAISSEKAAAIEMAKRKEEEERRNNASELDSD